MKRSFEYSLRPKVSLLSASSEDENYWSLEAAIKTARMRTRPIDVNLGKSAELFLDSSLGVSNADVERIISEVGQNRAIDPENRSVSFELVHPVPVSEKTEFSHIVSVQIKGIVFDSKAPISIYGGAGWPREYYFGNRDGLICRHEVLKENAVGYCFLREAVNEFLMCRELKDRLSSSNTQVPFPVGWGRFEKTDVSSTEFGFVILGHPNLIPGRERVYIEAVSEMAETGDYSRVGSMLALRAEAMRDVNQRAVVVPYRHFGNLSLTQSGRPYMHDLGNPTSLTLENMYSDQQFMAETFAQLVYALTPRKIAVPVPKSETYRGTVMKYLDLYTQTTLSSYYQDDEIGSQVKFEDFEETFFAALQEPLVNLRSAPATYHCMAIRKWLENYRRS